MVKPDVQTAIMELIDFLGSRDLVVGTLESAKYLTETLEASASKHLLIKNATGKDIYVMFTDNAGARKLILTDSDGSEIGNIDSNGVFTSAGGFVGALTGAVTGNVTGNVTGAVTGDVAGNLTGSVIANNDATHDYSGAHADWTLSATEKKAAVLVATNADGAANIIGPAENRQYVLRNASGQAITLKKSGGTGVAVANGKTAVLRYSNSVGDYIRVTADATH